MAAPSSSSTTTRPSAPARGSCSRPRASRSSARRPTARRRITEAAALRPEVVLLDVQLPDIDGFDVAERLTANGDAPAVILLEPRRLATSARSSSRSGARGFVPKAELSGERVQELL